MTPRPDDDLDLRNLEPGHRWVLIAAVVVVGILPGIGLIVWMFVWDPVLAAAALPVILVVGVLTCLISWRVLRRSTPSDPGPSDSHPPRECA